MNKECAHCGKEFKAARANKKFCSPRCKYNNWQANNDQKDIVTLVELYATHKKLSEQCARLNNKLKDLEKEILQAEKILLRVKQAYRDVIQSDKDVT